MKNLLIYFLIVISFSDHFGFAKKWDLIDFYTLQGSSLSSQCEAQSKIYNQAAKTGLLTHKSWPYQMIDASSKLQAGIASINLYDLGAFDQCINVEAPNFNGKYCLATLTFTPPGKNLNAFEEETFFNQQFLQNISRHLKQLTGHIDLYEDFTDAEASKASKISTKWSICVPETCSAQDVENHLNAALPFVNARVKEANCQTKPLEPKLGGGDWTFLSFLIIYGLIIIISTIYDIYNEMSGKKSYHPILIAFSWYTNGKKLVSTRREGDQIPCLHGIRFLSMMWVIGGHQYASTAAGTPSINKIDAIQWLSHWSSLITIGSTVSVDSFFCLSGCLLMYGFLKSRSKGIYFNIPLFYLHRYLRLTPALVIVMLFHITLLPYVSSGPLWKSSLPGMQDNCYDYWWSVLLYVQNYVNPMKNCIPQSWYLQVDMQLFILSPLILLPIAYWPKYAKYMFTVLIVTFVLTPFGIAYYYQLEPGVNRFSENPNNATKYYSATQARAGTWIVGLALGYLLYNTKDIRIIKSKKIAAIGWTVTTIVMLYIVFGLYPNQQPGYTYHRWYASLFIGLHRVVWCFGLSWIIVACVQGYGGIVNTLLSLKMFQVVGRLSYSMYLTHYTLLMVESGSTRVPIYFSNKSIIFMYWGTFMYTMIVAVIWALSFEYPVAMIDVLLLSKKKPIKPVQKEEEVEAR